MKESHKPYHTYSNALQVKIHFYALTRNEAVNMGILFYFQYLLYDYQKYQTQNELYNSILIWIKDDVIFNKRYFIDALSMFSDDLNYKTFENATEFINAKEREPSAIEKLMDIPMPLSEVKPGYLKKQKPKIKLNEEPPIKVNDKELQIIFLEWLSERLLDEYKGEKPSEKENRDDVRKWIEQKINVIKQEKISDSGKTISEFAIDKTSNPEIKKENIFCKSMPLSIAMEHFKVFILPNKKNDNIQFLTEKRFDIFINRAFLGQKELEPEILTFNIKPHKEKLFIVKRFYEFYVIGVDYEGTSQCQEKYIRLMSDNFTNWTYDEIKDNFGNKVKREW